MALAQRKYQPSPTNIRELETPVVPKKQLPIQPVRKTISVGEKFLFVLFTIVVVSFATLILHTQAQINDANREVEMVGKEISELGKQNTELAIQVKEKSTYEVIWEKAKELGLNLNENNVKVVPGR